MDELMNTLTEEQVYAYIFIVAGNADGDFSATEQRMIKVKLGSEVFSEMTGLYNAMEPGEREELFKLILQFKFPTQEDQEKLLSGLKLLFLADGIYSSEEEQLLKKLKDLMPGPKS